MEKSNNDKNLTSSEISTLWGSYLNETLLKCGMKYFLKHTDDEQIRDILELTLSLAQKRQDQLTDLFTREDFPEPLGFTENDANLQAPRLFSDEIYLHTTLNLTNLFLAEYAGSFSFAERPDILEYYSTCIKETLEQQNQAKALAKAKGIYIYAPHIPKPEQIHFVQKQSFIAGWFGDRRPLLGMEIANLVFNAKRNALGQAIITGFSQVAESKEVRRYFERGRDISGKHLDIFTTILRDNYLSDGSLLQTPGVTDSTISPFSDKLMMYLVSFLSASGIGQYGMAISLSPRHDLGVHYTRLTAEIAAYANDGTKMMIDHGWMEQPPMAADRKDLAK